MVAPQNNNLTAAFPLAPLPKPQMVKGNDASLISSYGAYGRCLPRMGRMAFYSRIIFARRGERAAELYKSRVVRTHANEADFHTEHKKEVRSNASNKAFCGRKPFYGNTVSSSASASASASSSSVWERSVASSQIACARTVADADADV